MSVFPKQNLGWWGFILGYQETPIFIHVLLFRPSILRAVYNILKLGSPESVHTNFWGLWKIFNYVSKLSCQIFFRGTPRLWSFCRVFFYDKHFSDLLSHQLSNRQYSFTNCSCHTVYIFLKKLFLLYNTVLVLPYIDMNLP